jgi:SAM-dependent methyltransferase
MQSTDTNAVLDQSRGLWDVAHRQARFRPRYPHDAVVRWTFRNFQRGATRPAHILDLGTGAGRHAIFLASEGYACSASDMSGEGLKHLDAVARERGLVIKTQEGPAHDLSCYADGSFDGIVCFGVLYYMSHALIEKTVDEMYRVLRPGGRLLCVTRADGDGRLRCARQIGPFTYVLDNLDAHAPSDIEKGLPMVFLPSAEVARLFGKFDMADLGRMTVTQGGFSDDDWIVDALKPAAGNAGI